jgi:hypothetical protein
LLYEVNAHRTYDPQGEVLLTKDRRYSSIYKTQTDGEIFIELWKLLDEPLFYTMARTINRFHWENVNLIDPYNGGNRCSGMAGAFLWEETGRPSIIAGFDYGRRRLVADYLNVETKYATFRYRNDTIKMMGNSAMPKVLRGLPIAMDILTHASEKKAGTPWIAFKSDSAPVSVFFNRPGSASMKGPFTEDIAVELLVRMDYQSKEDVGDPNVPWTVGSSVILKPHAKMEYTWAGQDLYSIVETRKEYGIRVIRVRIPKDAPGGIYELIFTVPGDYTVFPEENIPLSFYAPQGWTPVKMNPPVKSYFRVPENAGGAKISFQRGAVLFMPDGTPFKNGQVLRGWVELPADKPGLWSFEGVDPGKVEIEKLPGFFTMGNPALYVEPM